MGRECRPVHGGHALKLLLMTAAYDTYDYPRYWQERDYEHESEILAIGSFLSKIGKINSLADVGCGFGRLVPAYKRSSKKVTLIDPSQKLLNIAKKKCVSSKFIFSKSDVEDLKTKIKKNSFDTVLMVRVMHHVEDIDQAFQNLNFILKKDGYLIIEFANKLHGKALILNLLRGNFTFPIDIFPVDIRSKKNKKKNSIAFNNYHPSLIKEKLRENGFKIKEIRSVSNFRSESIKNIVPQNILLSMESLLQKPLSRVYFGPSIFILAKKA